MSQFNTYVQQVNDIAQASFEQIQTAEKAYKDAESKYSTNKRPTRGVWNADAATMARVARIEADYHEKKDAYDKLRRNLPDQVHSETAKIRRELEAAVSNFYAADPKALDANTMELLKSGILRPAEYARLFDAADQANNATMVRIIAQYADNAVEKAKSDDEARQLRYIASRGRNVDGRHYMEAFDAMADTLERCIRNTRLIKMWDELTGSTRDNF